MKITLPMVSESAAVPATPAQLKKIVVGAPVTYITRAYKRGGTIDKTGTLVKREGKITVVNNTAKGDIKSIQFKVANMMEETMTLASLVKNLNTPMPKAGESGNCLRIGATVTANTKGGAIVTDPKKIASAIANLEKKREAEIATVVKTYDAMIARVRKGLSAKAPRKPLMR